MSSHGIAIACQYMVKSAAFQDLRISSVIGTICRHGACMTHIGASHRVVHDRAAVVVHGRVWGSIHDR